MKSKFTPLVKFKKNKMQECERDLLQANQNRDSAQNALNKSYEELKNSQSPNKGNIAQLLQSRIIISAQRDMIDHNKEWLNFAEQQILEAKHRLKLASLEYEKFNYLETVHVQKIITAQKIAEAKDLDEVALMGFTNKRSKI